MSQQPPITDSAPGSEATPRNLTGQLGTVAIVFMVIAAAAPLTVIGGNVPLAVGLGNGAGAPDGFIIAALVLLVFVVGFVTMTPHVKEAGAFFAYTTLGLGKRVGMGTALVALISYTAIQLGVYGLFGWAVNDLVTHFGGPGLPWWLYPVFAIGIVAYLGYRHIEISAKVLGVALIFEIMIVVIMDASIFIHGGAEGISVMSFTPAAMIGSGPIGIAVLFALTGFIGFEATAVYRDEAKNPEVTIPRATYLAVIIIGVFYALSSWALVEAAGPDHAVAVAQQTLDGKGNMMLDTASHYIGTTLRDVMQVLLVSSLFACVLSFHNVVARYQFVLARKGLLPSILGYVHPKNDSPSISSLVQTVTALVLLTLFAVAGLDPLVGVFGSMAGVATVGMVLLMLTTSIAVFMFFAKRPKLSSGKVWRTRIAPVLAVIGLIGSLWLVVSNFTLVTGGSIGVSIVLGFVPVVAFVIGLFLRSREF
jgi:amino acid transporter